VGLRDQGIILKLDPSHHILKRLLEDFERFR